ncbi:MAG: NAD(P)H-hydrate dehydratase [Planctomycetota bacterium]
MGKVLVAGGNRDYCGAPALAALGALRAGAGLVRIAVPRSIQPVVAALRPEATTAGLPETARGSFALAAAAALARIAPAWDTLVLGPGGGRDAPTIRFFRRALAIDRPVVLDADGLFALGRDPERLRARTAVTILTPHEGEAGRLLGMPSAEKIFKGAGG